MPAIHLTTTMRVIRAHRSMRHLTIEAARDEVMGLALRAAVGTLLRGDATLIARLERTCGCSVAELAVFADHWLD